MAKVQTRYAALALGLIISSTGLLTTAEAQYGGGGYGGGYDRQRRSDDEGYDRRRGPRDDYNEPRRSGRDDGPRGEGGGGGMQARGGFVQSCRNIEQDGSYLSADCRGRGGGYNRSRIDVRSCRSIGNNNGRLVCE